MGLIILCMCIAVYLAVCAQTMSDAFAYADVAASVDSEEIAASIDIDHAAKLKERIAHMACLYAMNVAPVALVAFFVGQDYVVAPLMLGVIAWAAWTNRFRKSLNKKREFNVNYMSPSNWYDWQWIVGGDKDTLSRAEAIRDHRTRYFYRKEPEYMELIHGAAAKAGRFEITVGVSAFLVAIAMIVCRGL